MAFLDSDPAHTVSITWIPGHQDITGNERADEEAKKGTELQSILIEAGTFAHARRRAKAKVQRDWINEWKKAPKRGHFAIADRLPPSTAPTNHFMDLKKKREVFGRLTQCRTGHGYFGEYYGRFVPSESTSCPNCDEIIQTREHIIRECPRYDRYRHVLQKVSPTVLLPEILGTKEGIRALAKFLEKSGAFTKTGAPRGLPRPPSEHDPPEGESEDEAEGGEERRGNRERQ